MRWRSKSVAASNSNVPTSPGVYVIGCIDQYEGLVLSSNYLYVGETRNLRRRLDEHLPQNEQNAGLRAYLQQNYSEAICWFKPTELERRKKLQDDLIVKIRPRFNIVGLPEDEGENEK